MLARTSPKLGEEDIHQSTAKKCTKKAKFQNNHMIDSFPYTQKHSKFFTRNPTYLTIYYFDQKKSKKIPLTKLQDYQDIIFVNVYDSLDIVLESYISYNSDDHLC